MVRRHDEDGLLPHASVLDRLHVLPNHRVEFRDHGVVDRADPTAVVFGVEVKAQVLVRGRHAALEHAALEIARVHLCQRRPGRLAVATRASVEMLVLRSPGLEEYTRISFFKDSGMPHSEYGGTPAGGTELVMRPSATAARTWPPKASS